MKLQTRIILGILLIAVGVVFALNALGITDISLFFDGWWTLFLIVPCLIGLFSEKNKSGNLIGLLVGVVLLLGCQEIVSFTLIRKLLIPVVIVLLGLKLLFGGLFFKRERDDEPIVTDGAERKAYSAAFSGCDVSFDGEIFEGAELNATFGGIKCDLQKAIISKSCVLDVSAIFGGITIYVPAGVRVKVESNSMFGGMSNKTQPIENAPVLLVRGTCLFGGVEIK